MQALALAALGLWPMLAAAPAAAEPAHGIAMYGAPALPPDLVALPHVNPDAPRGGRMVLGEIGSFDSLNPYILRGRAPWALGALTVESLMGRSYDEPFTLYGLLAESVETDDQRSFVAFTLREEARFSDGSPVTVEDVLWSIETLGRLGQPRYRTVWNKIATMEATGPRSLRITFTEPDREMPLLLGLRPILQKAQFEGRAFDASSMQPIIGSGPYVVAEAEAGRFLRLVRNPDWWGAELPFNRGQHNIEEIRYDFFADAGVAFEAFKAGLLSVWREASPARWATGYGFPAVTSGAVVLSEIPHARPSGIDGFVFNTRRPLFADWRVREALIQAFNFEFINQTLNDSRLPRIASFFSNSELGMRPGPAEGRVAELLAPFADTLLPGTLEGYALPVSDGSEANRRGIRRATDLLEEAGWRVEGGVLVDAAGTPFTFEILLQQGSAETQAIASIYSEALRRLGISVRLTTVDSAQFTERMQRYDFDMTRRSLSLSLSPGNEQWLYWGAAGVSEPGTRNWAGIDQPAAEAMIRSLLTVETREDFVASVRALDRVLTAGRYFIPFWFSDVSRIAHRREFSFPERLPVYGDWIGFLPEVWWHEE